MTPAAVSVRLREWESRQPEPGSLLAGRSLSDPAARTLAEQLTRAGLLEVVELRAGLSVQATSYVGTVRLGDLAITIAPKIDQAHLLRLLRYAFGFRKLRLLSATNVRLDRLGFADLLVAQLLAEAAELIGRGLHRAYVPTAEWLGSPRGRLNVDQIARRGGQPGATLPCTHHPRVEDNLPNRVLRSGLGLAAGLATDLALRREARRLADGLAQRVTGIRLDAATVTRAERGLNRLTAAYEPALNLIRMLVDGVGVSLRESGPQLEAAGFLFDMNRFFQALLSRFLRENLSGHTVRDEVGLRGMLAYESGFNPRNRRSPTPRPDFVVERAGRVVAVLDAKYRDLWATPLPRDMLYQLALYALGHATHSARILYPTDDAAALVQRIMVSDPVRRAPLARVSLVPIVLDQLAELIEATGAVAARIRTLIALSMIMTSVTASPRH